MGLITFLGPYGYTEMEKREKEVKRRTALKQDEII